MTTNPSHALANLYFQRSAGIILQATLVIVGGVVFAFGIVELFSLLAVLSTVLAWVLLRPAAARALARYEHAAHRIDERAGISGLPLEDKREVGLPLGRYTALHRLRVRARARKALGIPADRFDVTQALVTSGVWFLFFSAAAAYASLA